MQASAQSISTGPAPRPVHTASHQPVLQRIVGPMQLPLPLHWSSQGASAQRISIPLQLPPPMQSMAHGQPSGHAIDASEHEPPTVHAMWQRPSSQPPVHSTGHAPFPTTSCGHSSTGGSPEEEASSEPSTSPDELDAAVDPDVSSLPEPSVACNVVPVVSCPLDPGPALVNGSMPDSIVQPSIIVIRVRRILRHPAGMTSHVCVITDVNVSRTTSA
jgi:hypothetical protein